jgi:ring-1,2-phenylacetyl-CoA epoxidase subunit PaaC
VSTLFDYTLALADDALVAAQRMGWWISRAPQLEEDVALANIGLDQLGQARSLLSYAGTVEAAGRDEDDLAYFRDEREFRNVCLVEREQAGFGVTTARLLIFATWQHELYAALVRSADPTLAGVAGKAVKETAYHVDHAAQWVLRLGDGTDLSHVRMQAALDAEWPWRGELFDGSFLDPALVESGVAVDPVSLRDPVEQRIRRVVADASLALPDGPEAISNGRQGRHTEAMGFLLAEMQHLARSHPGVTW